MSVNKMQSINSINLCLDCIEDLILKLKDGNEFVIDNLQVLNMYLQPITYKPDYEAEQKCLYSNLHVSCKHKGICNISHDYDKYPVRDPEEVKGILVNNMVKLTNDVRRFIVDNVAREVARVRQAKAKIST